MVSLKQAIKIAECHLSEGFTLYPSYGEAQGKYVFSMQNSKGMIPPGGWHWTVHKETGECKCEYLEGEFLAPYAPIKGYKKIELTE